MWWMPSRRMAAPCRRVSSSIPHRPHGYSLEGLSLDAVPFGQVRCAKSVTNCARRRADLGCPGKVGKRRAGGGCPDWTTHPVECPWSRVRRGTVRLVRCGGVGAPPALVPAEGVLALLELPLHPLERVEALARVLLDSLQTLEAVLKALLLGGNRVLLRRNRLLTLSNVLVAVAQLTLPSREGGLAPRDVGRRENPLVLGLLGPSCAVESLLRLLLGSTHSRLRLVAEGERGLLGLVEGADQVVDLPLGVEVLRAELGQARLSVL